MYLTDQVPTRTDAMSWYPYTPALESMFGFVDRFGDPGNMSVRIGSMLKVPRESVPLGAEDHRAFHDIAAINCKMPPRNTDQSAAIKESVRLLLSGNNHVVEAPTGWGKSYVGSAIAANVGQTTLICVPKSDLLQQWYDTLVHLIGVPIEQIGKIQANTCDYKGKRFVLGMVQSLMIEGRYSEEMYRYFGMLVFDETHRMAADCFQRVCQIFPAVYRLGLSATPKRSDGRDNVIRAHIGPVLVRGHLIPMSPKIIVQASGWSIPKRTFKDQATGSWKTETMPHSPGRMMGVVKLMAGNKERNALLCNFIRQAYSTPRTTLVLSDLIEGHLNILFYDLVKSGIKAEDIGYYVGGRSKIELQNAAHKRVILGTFKMVSEGTDYPHWDTLVLATPHANVKQPVGRVLREKPGKPQPVVYDLVDKDPIFHGFYKAREAQYYSLKSTIVKK